MSIENDIKAEWRLYAIEYLVSSLLAAPYVMQKDDGTLIEGLRQQVLEKARNKAFPGLDPAMSDHFAAELETALDRLLGMTKALVIAASADAK